MAACPYCHQDTGDGPRCEHCGEILYRYATDPVEEPAVPEEPVDPPRRVPPPTSEGPADPFEPDPFPPPSAPSMGETGTGPRLNVPTTRPPVPYGDQSPGGGGSSPPGTYPPTQADYPAKQAKSGPNGCAIAAIILGVLLVLGVVGLFFAGRSVLEEVVDGFEDGSLSFSVGGEVIDWDDVSIGDCVNFVDAEDQANDTTLVSTLERVACTAPHDAEVYALRNLPGGAWPGYESVYSRGDDICYDEFAPYVGIDYVESLYFYEVYTPSSASWDQGDRTIACTLVDVGGTLSKRLRGIGE